MLSILGGSALTAHGFCLSWQPGLIWLNLVSDLLTTLAYFSIPLALAVLVNRRRDLVFVSMFWLFGAFIVTCGTTHLMSIVTLWLPAYWLEGWIKAANAIVSVMAASMLWPLIPKMVALPSNAALHEAIAGLQAAEERLVAANARLEEMVRVDALTGLANRRRFDEALQIELARCARSKLPLSLILIDVDFFKSFNDQFGHPAGDACLRAVADVVGSFGRRPGDLAARYGGEELAVILPAMAAADAAAVAESIRLAVRDLKIPRTTDRTETWVTISLGVATLDPALKTTPPLDFVRCADAMLYRAKAQGRDTVVSDVSVSA